MTRPANKGKLKENTHTHLTLQVQGEERLPGQHGHGG